MIGKPLKLGFLASANGSSARAIMGAIQAGELDAQARLLVSNNRSAAALTFAAEAGVPALCIPTQKDAEAADARLADAMADHGVEVVVLSGYLRHIGPRMLARFPGRILNIHPGPLPAFGGAGMYGEVVHESVIAAGVAESAITIHLVDGEYDQGPVIAVEAVSVLPSDTATALESRIKAREPAFFLQTLQRLASGKLAFSE